MTSYITTSHGVNILLAVEAKDVPPRSALGLLVLFLLFDGPMHPYRMQKLLELQGKDRVVNIGARASLYQTLRRLVRLALVEVSETQHGDRYPDRVVYAITDRGREVASEWLRQMLSTTSGEYPEFIAAVSVLFGLSPAEAREQLELRAERRAAELADTERSIRESPPELPRLFLLEEEYRRTMLRAELRWLRNVIDELRTGGLDWSEQWLRQISEALLPPESDD
jgi:DNA-binding PadR family transcriptional regulator